MVTQGLAGAGSALVQLVPLVLHYIKKWFLGRTPRQAYGVTFMMPAADFGVLLPRLSLLATITFAYSVLSPLINLLAFGSFVMFFIAWKFLLVQVFDQPDEAETGGMYFPMAVNNLFVGLYIEHLCLGCLFFLRSSDEGAGAVVKGGFMLALLAITACVHVFMIHAFSPLYHYLPMSLATKKMAKKFEKEKKRKEGIDAKDSDDDEIDLFSRNRIQSVRRRIQKKLKIQHQSVHLDLDKAEAREAVDEERVKGRPMSDSTIVTVSGPSNPFSKETDREYIPLPEIRRQDTKDSTRSKASKKSKASSKKPRISFDEAAPRVKVDDDDSDDEEEEDDVHAFDHPSTYQEQPWIWIPKDILGLSEILAQDLRDGGVDASDIGAFMDEKGVVEVRRNPPDEEWTGGHDV